MLSWLWKSWKPKPTHPPNSLAYFQIYGQESPPATNYSGPVWRYQVPYDVKLECHMLPVLDEPSFLTRSNAPAVRVHPPVFQVAGQLRGEWPESLPVGEWLAQGTLWWLRQLGKPQVTGLLAYLLLVGHGRLDRIRFPEIDQTMTQLLGDRVATTPPTPEPPAPVCVTQSVVVVRDSSLPLARPWAKFPVSLQVGEATVRFLDRRDGNCCWRVGGREYWEPLWDGSAVSLLIEMKDWGGTAEDLKSQLRADFLAQRKALLSRLKRYPAAERRLRPVLRRLVE